MIHDPEGLSGLLVAQVGSRKPGGSSWSLPKKKEERTKDTWHCDWLDPFTTNAASNFSLGESLEKTPRGAEEILLTAT